MKALSELKPNKIKYVFCDIDDTLTHDGRLLKEAYSALWELEKNEIKVIPVTGRPAGWCELIARQWPVDGVIGENGAFYFRYQNQKMNRWFSQDEETRLSNQRKLKAIERQILKDVPGSAVASDQFCRLFDLAIDFCEDVKPLPKSSVLNIKSIFESHGATAKISSIHVNGWFGHHNKKTACERYIETELKLNETSRIEETMFVGDSPNDEPMFDYFENSFGVSNIKSFTSELTHLPNYVSSLPGGLGFEQIASAIINLKEN